MVAAAVVVGVGAAAQAVVAATAEQDQQDDDPAHITTAETIVTHKKYLQNLLEQRRRSFQDIPQPQKGASASAQHCCETNNRVLTSPLLK